MKKFQFKFKSVEQVRKSREDAALRVLAEAQRALMTARLNREELGVQLKTALERREKLADQIIGAEAYKLENYFIIGLKQRIIQADHGIIRSNRQVEKTMRTYLSARRQTRAIEVLRERAYEAYKKDGARREQRALDDLYVMRARFSQVTPDGEGRTQTEELRQVGEFDLPDGGVL